MAAAVVHDVWRIRLGTDCGSDLRLWRDGSRACSRCPGNSVLGKWQPDAR